MTAQPHAGSLGQHRKRRLGKGMDVVEEEKLEIGRLARWADQHENARWIELACNRGQKTARVLGVFEHVDREYEIESCGFGR